VPVITALNHVAIVTADLARFIDFYTRMFGLEVVFEETTPAFRHAILRISADSWLHPAEVPDNGFAQAVPAMFQRGHLDHISLTAPTRYAFDTVRDRLVQAKASDGRVDDLGAFHAIWFEDPDGMRGEVALVVDPTLSSIHEPRPLAPAS
jgi:catechol 2,3-dioxygenase-like lactoylglutathione lyase family enzyme